MIAGPHQNDRTLIERYAHKMTDDPKGASELFTEAAELHASKEGVKLKGKGQIHEHLSKAGKAAHRVTAHLPREGDDNYADILTETPGQEARVETVRFRTDGHNITKLEMVSSRKP
ncbi:MAG TPA: hypothetical protein VIG99_16215 [Myxococcaceae bacterium]|jgi:hypothetical protein